MFSISAVAQRYLREAAAAASKDTGNVAQKVDEKISVENTAGGIVDEKNIGKFDNFNKPKNISKPAFQGKILAPTPVHDNVDDTVVWNQRDDREKSQVLMGNSCAGTDFAFATKSEDFNSFVDTTNAEAFDESREIKFTMFPTLKAVKNQERIVMKTEERFLKPADATYTVVNETLAFDPFTDTAGLFSNCGASRTNFMNSTCTEESVSDYEEENFKPNSSNMSKFTFISKTTGQKKIDQSSVNFLGKSANFLQNSANFLQNSELQQLESPLPKRRRIDPINSEIWNENSDESAMGTEALFVTQAAATVGDQTKASCFTINDSMSRINSESCFFSIKAEPQDISMSECEAAFEDLNFDLPVRVRERYYEKCYREKKKVHFNTYFEAPRKVMPQEPLADFVCPDDDEEFDEKAKEFMMTFIYASTDDFESSGVGNPNQSFTFGSEDDEDEICDMDLEDEEFMKDRRLFSSTPTKKNPESSFSSSRSFKQMVEEAKLQAQEAEKSEKVSSTPKNLSENEKVDKRLSQSDRKSPPKNKIQSQSSRVEVSQKPAVQEEHLNRAVRQLSFDQSRIGSLRVAEDEIAVKEKIAVEEKIAKENEISIEKKPESQAPVELEVDDDATRDDVQSLIYSEISPVLNEKIDLRSVLSQNNSQQAPRSEIVLRPPSSQLEKSEILSVPVEYFKIPVSSQPSIQSPAANEGNEITPDEVEKFLVDYAKEKAMATKNTQHNFRGFTKDQRELVKNLNQEVVKEILNAMMEENSQTSERNVEVLQKIENVFISLLEAMADGKPMALKVPAVRKWKDCTMSQDILTQRESTPVKTISHGNKQSERSFAVNVTVLSESYKMLARNTTCTKRELYYRDVEIFQNQRSVDSAIDSICAMLEVQEFELGVLTSSKGLVAGDLIIKIDDDVFDCTNQCSVPQNPSAITSLKSNADYVLVVEKDTVFQRLVSEKIFEQMEEKIILVTAKGYPDVNTRVLLKRIADDLELPIYILVDADPHGIEIMMTYKFGSMLKIHNSQHLAVPSIQWIGFYPSDLVREDAMTMDLTEKDLKKIDELLERPYIDALLKRELNCFKTSLKKAEIESLYNFSINNLINDYIPRKIRSLETPLTQL